MGESRAILLFKEHRDMMNACSDQQAGQLIKAIFAFACDGEELETDDPIMKAFYSVFRNSIIRSEEKYEETVEKRRIAGQKGGLAKASNAKQMLANASEAKQDLANLANRNRKEIEIEKEIEEESVREIEEDSICSELSDSSEPPEIVPDITPIILNDGSDWYPSVEDVATWETLYPGVDVKRELARMREWCVNNPQRRKTKNGARRFVSTWLDKEQNRVGSRQPQKDKYTQRIEDVDNWGSSLFDQMQDW